VLEKTIYDKARDKMKQGKKHDEEETQNEKEKDYLAPILKKLGFSGKDLNEEAAIMVKNEALRNLKERLLTRAEIIQRRLEEEQKNLEQAYVRITPSLFNQTRVG
jgi:hydroxylamine reductase (hybrid-cluster protein)